MQQIFFDYSRHVEVNEYESEFEDRAHYKNLKNMYDSISVPLLRVFEQKNCFEILLTDQDKPKI